MNERHSHKRSAACSQAKGRLMDYFDGEVRDLTALGELESHVAHCPACQEELSALRELRQKVQTLPRPAAPEQLAARLLAGAQAAAAKSGAGAGAESGLMAPPRPVGEPAPLPSMTLPGARPAAPARRKAPRVLNIRRLTLRGLAAAAAVILIAGAAIGARLILEQRAAQRLETMQALFIPNVEYYNSTHYYYDLGDVKSSDPIEIEKWYVQPAQLERLGFRPVLPRWFGGHAERGYICLIRELPAAIIWYDWDGVKVALHIQKRNDVLTPYLVDLSRDVYKQAVTAAGLTMAAWRAAEMDYVLVVPEAQAPFVYKQVF